MTEDLHAYHAYVAVAVEGESDTGMAQTLLRHVHLTLSRPCLVKRGVANLDKTIRRLSQTRIDNPWIVFRDSDGRCPVELRTALIGHQSHESGFELRLACSMTEAWLLADAKGFADHFKISLKKIPGSPDELPHAKRELLHLCRTSRSRQVRANMVRADNTPGPLYVSCLNEFARERWNVVRAQERSPSLRRTVARLESMRRRLLTVPAGD